MTKKVWLLLMISVLLSTAAAPGLRAQERIRIGISGIAGIFAHSRR